jgi:L-iditol 2-dehydrogenase
VPFAARFYAPGDVRYEAVPMPALGPDELLIRIGAATTCGTDVKCFKRGHPVLLGNTLPAPFGHEGAGTIEAVGHDVTQWQVGQRVVFANSAPCGTCFFCKKQQPNLCQHLHLLNGTYADFLVLPAAIVQKNTYALPAAMPFAQAALTEPLAVALRCVMETPFSPGDTVAVLGVGAIGQMITRLLVWRGANVVVFGRNPARLAMAQQFGQAQHTVSLASQGFAQPEKHRQLANQGLGFDAVIEAIGLPDSWQYAVQLARRGGVVHWFAGCSGGSHIALDTRRVHYDELRLLSLFHHTPAYFQHALALQTTGELDFTPLITHHYPMAQFKDALQLVDAGEAIKVALTPEPEMVS